MLSCLIVAAVLLSPGSAAVPAWTDQQSALSNFDLASGPASFSSSSATSITDVHDSNANGVSYHTDTGVLRYVNPRIGTFGYSPNGNGGMVPSVSPPFGMTRWTPQTRENFISQCPYHDADRYIHGFQATHQPAIWMGESGQVVLSPGWGKVEPLFEQRGLRFSKKDERSTAYVYEVTMDADTEGENGWNLTEEAAKGGPVPGGGQAVPEDVRKGADGRVRRAEMGEHEVMLLSEVKGYQAAEDALLNSSISDMGRVIKVS